MRENEKQFISRKLEHIELALKDEMEATESGSLNRVSLIHDSLPDCNLSEISMGTRFLDQPLATPFFIAGMTGGHPDASAINLTLAEVASARGWIMGVGSQRREIDHAFEDAVSTALVTRFPALRLVANLGIAQLITLFQGNDFSKLFKLVERMRAVAVAIHLNPLQEAIQPEGTTDFNGSREALAAFATACPVPVIVKETGSGMSEATLSKLATMKLFAVDVSGLGGTHWGRIEGKRAEVNSVPAALGETFANWGTSTVESIIIAGRILPHATEKWASGGVRNGLDAAKLLALGATRVGFAKPALQNALKGAKALEQWMQTCEQELKVALFCTNSPEISALNGTKVRIEGDSSRG